MSTTVTDHGVCGACQQPYQSKSRICLNPNCSEAQLAATKDATRKTAKATAVTDQPRAFTRIGRVD